jgi:hypothetical protein
MLQCALNSSWEADIGIMAWAFLGEGPARGRAKQPAQQAPCGRTVHKYRQDDSFLFVTTTITMQNRTYGNLSY